MSDYNEMTVWQALKSAISYLHDIYDSCVPIVALRVMLWCKEGIVIGVWFYAKLRGIV